MTNKQKRAGKRTLKLFLNSLKEFDIKEDVILKLTSKAWKQAEHKKLKKDLLIHTKDFKIISFGFIFYENLQDENVFEFITDIKYLIKIKDEIFQHKIKDVNIRMQEQDGELIINPLFIKTLYGLALDNYMLNNEIKELEKEVSGTYLKSLELAKISEETIIFVLNDNELVGVIRKFQGKYIIKEIGIEKDYYKYESREELINLNNDYKFAVKIEGEFKNIIL